MSSNTAGSSIESQGPSQSPNDATQSELAGTTIESTLLWPTEASQYRLISKIGRGAFATVWKACTLTTSEGTGPAATVQTSDNDNDNHNDQGKDRLSNSCAIKMLNLDNIDTDLSEIRQEVEFMRLSSHANLLVCHAAFVHDTQLWVVTPLMDKGSSLRCLQQARRKKQESLKLEPHIIYILHQTLLGLSYIHENSRIHRDIKGGNLLLNSAGQVRVADFGVSGSLSLPNQSKAQTFVGTPCWMAPEVMEQVHGYDAKADLWSLGITALELAKGYAPYAKYPPMKVLIKTIMEDPPSLETYGYEETSNDDDEVDENGNVISLDYYEDWSRGFKQMIKRCLEKDPSKRPTCQELLQNSPVFSHLQPDDRRAALQREICALVDNVGQDDAHPDEKPQRPLGHSRIGILERPAGTSWVFEDGSQVLVPSPDNKEKSAQDVLNEIDQFGKSRGGENYRKDATTTADARSRVPGSTTTTVMNAATVKTAPSDDQAKQQFLDEFEKSTRGENAR